MAFCENYFETPQVHRGGHNLVDYCTSWVEAANDAVSVQVHIACRKKSRPEESNKSDIVILHYI